MAGNVLSVLLLLSHIIFTITQLGRSVVTPTSQVRSRQRAMKGRGPGATGEIPVEPGFDPARHGASLRPAPPLTLQSHGNPSASGRSSRLGWGARPAAQPLREPPAQAQAAPPRLPASAAAPFGCLYSGIFMLL